MLECFVVFNVLVWSSPLFPLPLSAAAVVVGFVLLHSFFVVVAAAVFVVVVVVSPLSLSLSRVFAHVSLFLSCCVVLLFVPLSPFL